MDNQTFGLLPLPQAFTDAIKVAIKDGSGMVEIKADQKSGGISFRPHSEIKPSAKKVRASFCCDNSSPSSGIRIARDSLARELFSAKDEIIKSAITHHIGGSWSVDQLIGRAKTLVRQDKVEDFFIDGVRLVSFLPPECFTENNFIHGSFIYQLHYE